MVNCEWVGGSLDGCGGVSSLFQAKPDVAFQPANQPGESGREQCRQESWLIDFLGFCKHIFDFIIIITEELLKREFLPLLATPFRVYWPDLSSCHNKQSKVRDLLHDIIG